MKGSNWIVFAEDVDSFSVIAAANVRYMTGESRECVIQLVTQLLLNTSSDDVQEDEMCVQSVVAIMRLIVALYNRNKDFIMEDVILRCFDRLRELVTSNTSHSPASLLALFSSPAYWAFLAILWNSNSHFHATEEFQYSFLKAFSTALQSLSETERNGILQVLSQQDKENDFILVSLIQILIASFASPSSPLFLSSLYYQLLRLAPLYSFHSSQPDFSSCLLFHAEESGTTPSLLDWWDNTYTALVDDSHLSQPRSKLREMKDKYIQLVLGTSLWMKLLKAVASDGKNPETLHQFCLVLGQLFYNYGISTVRAPFVSHA